MMLRIVLESSMVKMRGMGGFLGGGFEWQVRGRPTIAFGHSPYDLR
jgi:hypothetical protein